MILNNLATETTCSGNISRGGNMNDLTKVFEAGIRESDNYDPYKIIKIFNKTEYYNCSDDDEASWMPIWENKERKSIYYAYVSQFFPAALVKETCPEPVKNILIENGIYIAKFDEPFSCEEDILKKYVRNGQIIIDDRFLDNCDFSFDDERLFWIYQCLEHGRKYVAPYCFTFEEIR